MPRCDKNQITGCGVVMSTVAGQLSARKDKGQITNRLKQISLQLSNRANFQRTDSQIKAL